MLTLMKNDLGLDPSDPLNLLLHNHSQHNMQPSHDDSSPSVGTPPNWNSLSSMWPPEDKMDDMSQFTSMDLGMGMGIDTTDFGLFNSFQITFEAPSPLPSSDDDPAAKLANCVRKNAGLVLAMQIGSNPQYQLPAFTAPPVPSYPTPNTAASVFTTAPIAPSAPPTPVTPVQTVMQSRPKMSHTTIECRYRTNLNARIQLLRQAVPALCVVNRAAAIKADHIDACNSVKIACKCSKANVLGKAVEYICVLKNCEKRLTRELKGLKTLLCGLVGGTELLGEGNANEDDMEDNNKGESGNEGGTGRRRKKKRGRPRKVAPLPASALTSSSSDAGLPALSTSVPMHSSTAVHAQHQQEIMQQQQDLAGGPQQYLLGAFALFSFFANANVSSPSSHQSTLHVHAHKGHVLTPIGIAMTFFIAKYYF
ncbi:hypothetical protein B0H16DRAFT_1760474 [Mycena metata]|uniref:BHLH domain-containing protein n=1 Tax=Mycena metata TaxID=1033252 RepID=A0AAD7JZ78_9AGAR|nr:hypothetical protein B0H16DRAFT_1760474 [Mycena metata]